MLKTLTFNVDEELIYCCSVCLCCMVISTYLPGQDSCLPGVKIQDSYIPCQDSCWALPQQVEHKPTPVLICIMHYYYYVHIYNTKINNTLSPFLLWLQNLHQ